MAIDTKTRRNPRRMAEANAGAKPRRKTRRGSAKGKRKRAQSRADRYGFHAIDGGCHQPHYDGLPSNATHNQQTTYVSPAAAKAARDELLARLGLIEARPKI